MSVDTYTKNWWVYDQIGKCKNDCEMSWTNQTFLASVQMDNDDNWIMKLIKYSKPVRFKTESDLKVFVFKDDIFSYCEI